MPIITKFNPGDSAYLREKASLGVLSRVKIVEVSASQVSHVASVKYQLYGDAIYNKTWYTEDSLLNFGAAKELALRAINQDLEEVQGRKSKVAGDFLPILSRVNVI